ncbi:MAG: hypothetical protein WB784_02375 [Rhodanobacteraceae bacterium]
MIAQGRQAFITLVVATVAASVLGGLFLLGSPEKARERGLDARRIADIRAIANAVDLYWTRQGRLPASLADLSHEQGIRVNPLDPETKRPYGYRVLGESRYELCAEFASKAAQEGYIAPSDFWAHGTGTQCFRLEPKAIKH